MRYSFKRRSPISRIVRIAFLFLLTLSMSIALGGGAVLARGVDDGGNGATIGQNAARQVLPANDGWAAANGGTTGGSTADKSHVFTVTNRAELVKALNGNDSTPKIIIIKGVINGNEDDAGNALTCDNYITGGYSLNAYLQTYDPAVWGRTSVPSGPLEDARKASEANQAARVKITIPANTTLIGDASGARVLGANFILNNVNNVIIRNIQFENAFDCFPQWDPTDGSAGNWNSAFDNLSLTGATHVWIDHNSFTDGTLPDSAEPTYFGREFQQHDGELDPTKATDLVTISWNRFANHDKTMLVGSSDSATTDAGKLRITVHHNDFENVDERLPRVRFGQDHIYDNFYNEATNAAFSYALGVGISSQIFAQNNYYVTPSGFSSSELIRVFNGTMIHTEGDIVNGQPTDLLAAYNAAHDPDLSGNVGWTPRFHGVIDPTARIPSLVRANAGASSTIRVAQNGKGDFTTVQDAINAVPTNNATNTTISIAPGTYSEVVKITKDKPYITLLGGTKRPEDTIIAFDNWSGTPKPGGGTLGTAGSATATFNANDFAARFITFANTFDENSHPETNQHQAVAVMTAGDRLIFDHDRFLGDQDTLYVNSPSTTSIARQLYTNSYIEGNIDFIFGRGTAVFDKDTIFIKDKANSKMTAAATPAAQQFGFLFINDKITSNTPAASSFLGRPWPATPDARAQVTVRESWLPTSIASPPWQDWTSPPVAWQSVRFAEYHNFGPGAAVTPDRPQLTDAQAAQQTPFHYLVGVDGWMPDGTF